MKSHSGYRGNRKWIVIFAVVAMSTMALSCTTREREEQEEISFMKMQSDAYLRAGYPYREGKAVTRGQRDAMEWLGIVSDSGPASAKKANAYAEMLIYRSELEKRKYMQPMAE